jgi:cytoskeletal protein CcmA (bactofilin family)
MDAKVVELGDTTALGVADCVGAGLRIQGEISGKHDLLVEGTVDGPIHLDDHKLVVGVSGQLNSNVVAREIIVHGSVKGNLRASESIEITKNGSVVGDLKTAHILIQDGASVRGSIEIDREAGATAADKVVRSRAATATNDGRQSASKSAAS